MNRKATLYITVLALAAALSKETGAEIRVGIETEQNDLAHLPFERSMSAPIHSAFNAPHKDPHSNPWSETRRRQHNITAAAPQNTRPRAHSMSMR